MKRVLITGANSYIGVNIDNWLSKSPTAYSVDTIDMIDGSWREKDFCQYDVIIHVAGIAHADVDNISEERKQLYYRVNTDLAIEVAQKAKKEGAGQFILMSSMIIYSGCKEKIITKEDIPIPLNCYGDSKWQADQKVRKLETTEFKVVVLRAPMIYGKNSRGNYPELAKLAARLPVFPVVKNKRSMLHIDNLCEFIRLMVDNEESGVFFPQNREYTVTSDMVRMIAAARQHKIIMVSGFGWGIKLMMKIPGRIGVLATKAFGDSAYDMQMSEYKEDYRINSLEKSVILTER
jgi:nucleoside-diphosphate-sugar epimerase